MKYETAGTTDRVTDLEWLLFYEETCGESAGFSAATIALNRTVLEIFLSFIKETGRSSDISLLGADDIRAFIVHLKSVRKLARHRYARPQPGGLSGHTVNTYMRTLRACFNRWVADGIITRSPFSGLKIPGPPVKIMPVLDPEQIVALLKAINTSTPEGFRNSLLIRFYLDTGCRLSEVTGARLGDLDLKTRTLTVWGKGHKQRTVPFGGKVTKLLLQYLKMYRPEPALPSYDQVFLTRDGRPLTNNRVQAIFKKAGQKAAIPAVHPHMARHTFCTMYLRNGGNLYTLQQITGHTSLEVLKGYVSFSKADISDAHRKCSPIDNLKGA